MDISSWDDLRILLAIHRSGSLLAAGRRLGLSTSTAGRRLDALEAACGTRLVRRGQAGTVLEPQALRLVALAQALEHGLHAERRDRDEERVTVKVSVPDGMAHAMAQALLTLRHQYPLANIELLGENRMADVARREADIGVRLARSSSSVLVEKALPSLRFGLFASADYVRCALPTRRLHKAEAANQAFIGLDSQWKDLPQERWMAACGAREFPFRSGAILAILEAVQQGVGIAALVEQDPRTSGLVRIEPPLPGPTQPLYLVYHHELRRAPHIKAAVAAITGYLGQAARVAAKV